MMSVLQPKIRVHGDRSLDTGSKGRTDGWDSIDTRRGGAQFMRGHCLGHAHKHVVRFLYFDIGIAIIVVSIQGEVAR